MLKSLLRPLAAAGLLTSALAAHAQTPPAVLTPASAAAADEIAVELRVVTVAGKDGREAAAKLFEATDEKPTGSKQVAFLDDDKVKALLERCQKDRTCQVMQAPKVTLEDRQQTTVTITDPYRYTSGLDVTLVKGNPVMAPKTAEVDLGTKFQVTGHLSADRKSVQLVVKYDDKRLASPHVPLFPVTTYTVPKLADGSVGKPVPVTKFIQNPTFHELSFLKVTSVPDGGTVAIRAGTQKREVREEAGVPVLSEIPYLNRLFKNVGIAEMECDVVVLATAWRVTTDDAVKPVVFLRPPVEPVVKRVRGCAIAVLTAAPADDLESLLSAYRAACEAGNKDEATRLAVQALAKDPTCFGRR